MKLDIEKAIDGTIAMFNDAGKRVIFPVFMDEADRDKLGIIFAKLDDFYVCSVGSEEDSLEHEALISELEMFRDELIKKYKRSKSW